MDHTEAIAKIFHKGSGYARTAEILAAGIHFSHLRKLEDAGLIVKIKRGYYRWEGMAFWGSELPEIARLVPGGVFCLFTAAEFHGLTTFQSWQYHLAIQRSAKVTGLPKDRIKILYWSSDLLDFGIETIHTEGGSILITTPERTVCDFVKYRNKTGIDTMLEAIRAYVLRKDKNLTSLLECASRLRVEKIIKPYLTMAV